MVSTSCVQRLCSNSGDVCKSPRKVRNVTRRIFHRLYPAGHQTTVLCEEEGDEMTEVHGLRGGATSSVEEEWLLLFTCIQDAMHVTAGGKKSV